MLRQKVFVQPPFFYSNVLLGERKLHVDSELGLVSRGALEAENPPVLRGGRGGAGGTFWGCPGSAGTREL